MRRLSYRRKCFLVKNILVELEGFCFTTKNTSQENTPISRSLHQNFQNDSFMHYCLIIQAEKDIRGELGGTEMKHCKFFIANLKKKQYYCGLTTQNII